MRFMRLARAACAIAALSVPQGALAQEFQIPVTSEFVEFSMAFTGGVADPYMGQWSVMPYEGQLALCGIGFLRDNRFASTIRGMARGGSLVVDNQTIPVDLTFFTRARSTRALRSGTATCRVVSPMPTTAASIELRFEGGRTRL